MEEFINTDSEQVLKSVARRRVGRLTDILFDDYFETYGKEEDAKLLSWQQQKELRKIMKDIIETVNKKRSEVEADLAVELISETYYDLIELKEVLNLRLAIIEIIQNRKDFNEELRTIFAETYDLDLLRGILFVLKNNTSDVTPLLDDILGLSEDYQLYEIYMVNIFKYYSVKNKCHINKEVLDFLDRYFYKFCTNDGISCIMNILEEYSDEKILLPFEKETIEYLERKITFFKGSGVFEQKNEENLIKLINGVFVWLNEIPQLGELSFQPMVKIERKLTKNENVVQGNFNPSK